MRFSLLVAGIFALLVAISCNKMNQKETAPNSKPTTQMRVADVTPENANNPEDGVGAIHNATIDAIKQYYENTQEEGLSDYLLTWAYSEYEVNLADEPIGESIDLSQAAIDYFEELDDVGDSYFTYNSNYSTFKDAITELEFNILSDNYLSGDEKTVLLGTTSVARYSAYYWWEYNDETNVAKSIWQEDKRAYNRIRRDGVNWVSASIAAGLYSDAVAANNLAEWVRDYENQFMPWLP